MTKEEAVDKLGELADRVDNLAHALRLRVEPRIHVEALSKSLPEVVVSMKEIYVALSGENPWE